MPGFVLVTPPATEPLTLAESKAHLRVDHASDDALITAIIVAARQAAEDYMGRALITQTCALWLNAPCVLRTVTLPRAPLQAVTAVTCFDDADAETTFAATGYRVDNLRAPGQLILKDDTSFPSMRRVNGIKITYTAGYGAAADVPAAIKQGILAHIAMLYEQRGDTHGDILLPALSQQLYHPYKIVAVH